MKKILAIALAATMAFALVSCSAEKEATVIATGGTGGTYYPVGGVMQTVLNPVLEKSELSVSSTGASSANIMLVTDGEAQYSILQNDVLSYAHTGSGLAAFEGAAETTSLWVTGLYNETVQIVAAPGYTSVEDLAGEAVIVGDVGSGTELNAQQVLEAYGMTFDDVQKQNGDFTAVSDGIKDAKIAAGFTTAGAPTTSIVELSTTNDFELISLSQDAVDYLTSTYSFYVQEDLPVGTYTGIDEVITCVAVKAALVASEDLSEDVVYEFTKALFENLDDLKAGHAKFELVSAETALDGASAPVHPGALKYYEEIGVA